MNSNIYTYSKYHALLCMFRGKLHKIEQKKKKKNKNRLLC